MNEKLQQFIASWRKTIEWYRARENQEDDYRKRADALSTVINELEAVINRGI